MIRLRVGVGEACDHPTHFLKVLKLQVFPESFSDRLSKVFIVFVFLIEGVDRVLHEKELHEFRVAQESSVELFREEILLPILPVIFLLIEFVFHKVTKFFRVPGRGFSAEGKGTEEY